MEEHWGSKWNIVQCKVKVRQSQSQMVDVNSLLVQNPCMIFLEDILISAPYFSQYFVHLLFLIIFSCLYFILIYFWCAGCPCSAIDSFWGCRAKSSNTYESLIIPLNFGTFWMVVNTCRSLKTSTVLLDLCIPPFLPK